LAVRGLDMLSRAAVAVSASSDLVVEGAVDFILLGAEDGGEVVGHISRVSRDIEDFICSLRCLHYKKMMKCRFEADI
jgi:hypothetical protein